MSHLMLDKSIDRIDGVLGGGFSHMDEDYYSSSLSLSFLSRECGSQLPMLPQYRSLSLLTHNSSDRIADGWFVNGQFQPTLPIQPGEWRLLELLAASGDRILEVELTSSPMRSSLVCDLRLISLDGIFLSSTRTGSSVRLDIFLFLFPLVTFEPS